MGQQGGDGREVCFDVFRLNTKTAELTCRGTRVWLAGQPVRILELLLARPGDVITREELRQRLWGDDTFVDFDHGLRAAIRRLRVALGDSAREPRFVETLPRRGYRYVGPAPRWTPDEMPASRAAEVPRPSSRRSLRRRHAVVAVLLASAALVAFAIARGGAADAERRPVIAVLPFADVADVADDAGQPVGGESFTEAIIHALASLDPARLGVVAHAESRRFRSITEITYALRTDYVLEGSLDRQDGALRVAVRLIRFQDRTQVWAASFDGPRDGSIRPVADVARLIAASVQGEIGVPPDAR